MQRCRATAELVWITRDLRASNLAITVDLTLGLEAGQWGGKSFALAGGSTAGIARQTPGEALRTMIEESTTHG